MSPTSQSPGLSPTNKPSQPHLIYILGSPGAGKGALSALIIKHSTNTRHLSVGDHLRVLAAAAAQTTPEKIGEMDRDNFIKHMEERRLLPAETIVSITADAIKAIIADSFANSSSSSSSSKHQPIILVDGFSRSLESADLAFRKWGAPVAVLFFDCPRELAESRFLKRRRSADDDMIIFHTRYEQFARLNEDILELYSDRVIRIGTEAETDETWEVVKARVRGLFCELGAVERMGI